MFIRKVHFTRNDEFEIVSGSAQKRLSDLMATVHRSQLAEVDNYRSMLTLAMESGDAIRVRRVLYDIIDHPWNLNRNTPRGVEIN